MYCKNCGKDVPDIAAFCTGCGVPRGAGNKFCFNCGSDTPELAVVCVKCGCSLGNNPYGQANNAYGQPNNAYGQPNNPYGQPNQYYNPAQQKSKIAAGLLGIFIGSLGIHNFYLGFTSRAIIQIVVTVVTCGIGGIWGFIEGIMILAGSIKVDSKGIPLKD